MLLKKFSEEPVYIQKIEDTQNYQLSKQKFSYNCEICGKLESRYLYNYIKRMYNNLLCRECLVEQANQKRRKTCINKYGADNIRKSQVYKDHCKQLHLKNYGVENVSQSKEIKKKKEQTCLNHFGVKWPGQSNLTKEKSKQTCLKRYGFEKASQSEVARKIYSEKAKQRMQNGGAKHLKEIWKNQKKRKKLSEKVSKTWLAKTPKEIREIRKKASKRYTYQNEYFDSSWELAFYKD